MGWLAGMLKALLARTRFERDMREELRLHLEHRADDLMATGVPREEALRRAPGGVLRVLLAGPSCLARRS